MVAARKRAGGSRAREAQDVRQPRVLQSARLASTVATAVVTAGVRPVRGVTVHGMQASAEASIRRAAVEHVARVAGPAMARQREALHAALTGFVAEFDTRGQPPGIFNVIRRQRDEPPLNRLLAWLLDPEGDHGLGREPLRAVARALAFTTLDDELAGRGDVSIFSERAWPEGGFVDDQPDLIVVTPGCALLIENKVYQGESRLGQYADYRRLLHAYAERDGRIARCHLWARIPRARPADWDGFTLHGNLALALRQDQRRLARERGDSHWGVTAFAMVVHALRNEPALGPDVAEARRLLGRWGGLSPEDFAAARRLAREHDLLEQR